MASYKLISYSVNQLQPEIIVTNVEYTFDNNQKVTKSVDHFRPNTLAEVAASIVTKGKDEWLRIKAVEAAEQAATALIPYIGQNIAFSQT